MTYQIKDWEKHFETYETKKLKSLHWVPVPNKHDGKGFKKIMRMKDGPMIYAAWLLLVQVASKCSQRGVLEDQDGPLTSEDLELKTEMPKKYFDTAFKPLCDVGWLSQKSSTEVNDDKSAGLPAEDAAKAGESPVEGKGREGKGKKESVGAIPSPPAVTDESWMESLKTNPTYTGIDVQREFGKMSAWCENNRKLPSRKRFINWLNNVEKPMGKPATGFDFLDKQIEKLKRL